MIRLRKIGMLLLLAGMCMFPGSLARATEDVASEELPETVQQKHIYEVKPDGTGDFVAIQEGVDSVASGDTLLIHPGVYEENVVIKDKIVNLLGVSSEYCILKANSDNYHSVPLTVAAGRISGLTIYGVRTKENQNDLSGAALEEMHFDLSDMLSVYKWQNRHSGYAIHVDDQYGSGKTLYIENCNIVSENNYCIGIGCWSDTEITISDCKLFSCGSGGCVFLHNHPVVTGKARVTVRNSQLRNYMSPYVMAVHSEGTQNPVYLTFQNVAVSAVAYEDNECYNESNFNTWFQIDQLTNPGVQSFLRKNGYSSARESTQLVHQYTYRERKEFYEDLQERGTALKSWPLLEEGITYWESSEDLLWEAERKRYSIEIKNMDENILGDGWCGLAGIYLTETSYGNTLPEMNYPRLETAVGPGAESNMEGKRDGLYLINTYDTGVQEVSAAVRE
ncbi:MAG: hypothetical protein K2P39_00690 [Lachnospiraceae bacterium]|nr:hypothetical protein [Lachnospiraceae bacterium]